MKRKGQNTRRSNAGIGYNFDFHGAFNKKADAVKKEATTPGAFVRPIYFRDGMRYAVLTRRKNPDWGVPTGWTGPTRMELFDKKRDELIRAGDPPAVASLKALEYVHGWERKNMPWLFRKQNSAGLDRFLGRKPRLTSADWRRAGDSRRRQALKSAGVPARLLPAYSRLEWSDLQETDPGFVSRVMTGLSKTYKNPRTGRKSTKRKKNAVRMTYDIARAAAMDAANRQMRAAGRKKWNQADANLATRTLNRLYPEVRRNPEERKKAAAAYEMFHGRAPKKVTELVVPAKGLPSNSDYAKLGDLVELHIPGGEIAFKHGERPMLVTDPAAKRLYFIGGNQDLSAVPAVRKANPGKGLDDLGECTRIVYYSRKQFTDFKPVEWDHEFGEEGGARPRLMFDRKRKQIHLVGGDYKIKDVGIVN